MDDVEQYIF